MPDSTELNSAPGDVLLERLPYADFREMAREACQLAIEEIGDREAGWGPNPELNIALCRAIISVVDAYLVYYDEPHPLQAVGPFGVIELYQVVRNQAWKLVEGSGVADPLRTALLHALVAAIDGWLADCFEHPQLPVELGEGRVAQIDELIVPLIRFLNAHPGIRTVVSCQGGESPNAKAACVELREARAELQAEADKEPIRTAVKALDEAQTQLEANPESIPEIGVECETRTAVAWLEQRFRASRRSGPPGGPYWRTISGAQVLAWSPEKE